MNDLYTTDKHKKKEYFFQSKKRFAWVFLSILKNNTVTAPLYYLLLAIEYLQLIFIYVIFAIIFHGNNEKNAPEFTAFMNSNVMVALNYLTSHKDIHIFLVAALFSINIVILVALTWLASQFDSPEKAKKYNLLSKILSLVFQIYSKVLYTSQTLILLFIFKNTELDLVTEIVMYGAISVCLLLTNILEFFTKYLLTVRLRLINEIPWCSQKSYIQILKTMLKFVAPITLVIDQTDISTAIMFILTSIVVLAYIYFQPYYNRVVYYLELFFLSTLFSLYFGLCLNIGNKFNDLLQVLLFFVSFLFPAFMELLAQLRQNQLKNRLITKSLKSEYEIEKALTLFTEDIENYKSKESQKSLLGLIMIHREQCKDQERCFCTQFDECLLATRVMIQEKKNEGERQRLKNINDHRLRNLRSRQGLLQSEEEQKRKDKADNPLEDGEKELNIQQEEQKQFMKGIINPLFQAEFMVSQAMMAQMQQQAQLQHNVTDLPPSVQKIIAKYNSDFLDFGTLRMQTILNIIYKIMKDSCDQHHGNIRLLMFKAYFELFIMKKKYLSHQTLTMMAGENLSWINYAQYHVDQQFMIENAILLYQQKEDQMIDVDKISTHNYQFQKFFDLNKETSYQLSNFWNMLTQKSTEVDIEKLYNNGVKTSELIKQTKDKFHEIVNLGIDKRNYSLYYIYANFNKYVLNSNDLYTEYLYKMKQIQSMNKTIYENYKGQLVLEADKAGFVIVRGSYTEFGKILFANKKLCLMLGYHQEQIIGKLINMIMPSIISENHHHFLSIFRDTGNPVFIQRQQQLFLKNSKGYISPFTCYIKFHYDKVHGHVFCAIVNKCKTFYPFKNKKKHFIDEILTVMTDDTGSIYEISPSVTKFLGLPIKVVQQNQMFLQDTIKIEHLVKMDMTYLDTQTNKEMFTQINPSFIADGDNGRSVLTRKRMKRHDSMNDVSPVNLSLMSIEKLSIDVRIKMAKVRHKDILTVRYFFIQILEESSHDMSHIPRIQNMLKDSDLNDYTLNEETKQNHDNNHVKAISSTSSDSKKYTNDFIEKDIDSLLRNDKRTPKVLKQILWLVIFGMLSTIIIASIIMALFLQNSNVAKNDLEVFTISIDRSIISSQVMNLLRTLINFSLGIESYQVLSQTAFWQIQLQNNQNLQINTYLSELITESLSDLKGKQQSLDLIHVDDKNIVLNQQLNMVTINNVGIIESQNQSSSVALNLFVSNIIDIVSNVDMLKQTVAYNLSFTDYFSYHQQLINHTQQYQLIELENQMYFVFDNYVQTIQVYNKAAQSSYQQIGIDNLQDSLVQKILILTCISITSLIIIMGLVSPVTFKIRKQKYQVLMFFLRLDEGVVDQCHKNTITFESQFFTEHVKKLNFEQDDRHLMVEQQSDYVVDSSIDSVAPSETSYDNEAERDKKNRLLQVDQKLEEVRRNYIKRFQTHGTKFEDSDFADPEDNVLNMEYDSSKQTSQFGSKYTVRNKDDSVSDSPTDNNSVVQIQPLKSRKSASSRSLNFNKLGGLSSLPSSQKPVMNEESSIMRMMNKFKSQKGLGLIEEEQINMESVGVQTRKSKFNRKAQLSPIKSQGSFTQQKTVALRPQQTPTFNYEQSNNLMDTQQKQSQMTVVQSQEDQLNPKENEKSKDAKEAIKEQEQRIQNISTRSQTSVCCGLFFLFLGGACYFIGIFLMTYFSVDQFKNSFYDLDVIYQRADCQSMLFFQAREDILTNVEGKVDLYLKGYKSLSMDQLWQCMDLEDKFTEIKKDPPKYLSGANDLISQAESDRLCSLLVTLDSSYSIGQCQSIENDALSKGISLVNQDMIKSNMVTLLDFFSRTSASRSNSYILSKLQSTTFLDYLNTNQFILTTISRHINEAVFASICNYIDTIKNIHVSLFSVMLLACISMMLYFICYLFERMKKDMLSSHTMISMLPKMLLQKSDQMKIKKFLIS